MITRIFNPSKKRLKEYERRASKMKTGEGKSLTAAIAATVLAIQNRKVYIVTVNDYLVKRDSEFHAPLYEFFNKNVGKIISDNHRKKNG